MPTQSLKPRPSTTTPKPTAAATPSRTGTSTHTTTSPKPSTTTSGGGAAGGAGLDGFADPTTSQVAGGPPPDDLVLPISGRPAAHGSITRAEIIKRAQQWLTEQVPYSESRWWADTDGTYRQDCSGYVSMAWALPQHVDFWTGNLNTVAHPIPVSELKPGDILLSYPHTVIFAGWTDAAHTQFSLYEEAHPGTNARYVTGAPIAEYLHNGFSPYRYDGVVDTPGEVLPGAPGTGVDYAGLGDETDPNGKPTPPQLPYASLGSSTQESVHAVPAQISSRRPEQHAAAGLAADSNQRLAADGVISIVIVGGLVGSTVLGARSVRRPRRG